MGLGLGGIATGKVCNLYPRLCLEIVFSPLKLTKNVTYIIIKQFSLETGNLIINWVRSYAKCRTGKTIPTIWQNMKERGFQKSQFSNSLVNSENFGSTG